MNENQLKKPSIDLLKQIISRVEKPKEQKLKISKPYNSSSWVFRLSLFLGLLLIVALLASAEMFLGEQTSIIAVGLLILLLAAILFQVVFHKSKKSKDL